MDGGGAAVTTACCANCGNDRTVCGIGQSMGHGSADHIAAGTLHRVGRAALIGGSGGVGSGYDFQIAAACRKIAIFAERVPEVTSAVVITIHSYITRDSDQDSFDRYMRCTDDRDIIADSIGKQYAVLNGQVLADDCKTLRCVCNDVTAIADPNRVIAPDGCLTGYIQSTAINDQCTSCRNTTYACVDIQRSAPDGQGGRLNINSACSGIDGTGTVQIQCPGCRIKDHLTGNFVRITDQCCYINSLAFHAHHLHTGDPEVVANHAADALIGGRVEAMVFGHFRTAGADQHVLALGNIRGRRGGIGVVASCLDGHIAAGDLGLALIGDDHLVTLPVGCAFSQNILQSGAADSQAVREGCANAIFAQVKGNGGFVIAQVILCAGDFAADDGHIAVESGIHAARILAGGGDGTVDDGQGTFKIDHHADRIIAGGGDFAAGNGHVRIGIFSADAKYAADIVTGKLKAVQVKGEGAGGDTLRIYTQGDVL